MPTYEQAYRLHVIPDLRRMCERLAIPIAWEDGDFGAAIRGIEDEARRRGADGLPGFRKQQLKDWIARTLLAELNRHVPDASAGLAQIDQAADRFAPGLHRAPNFDAWLADYLAACGCS